MIDLVFCVFKQKTAYEMRISDWSSDVCSSDLFGFLIPDAGGKDVFLSPRQMRSLMNGDRVLVCAHTASRRSTSGETCTVPKAVSRAGTPGGGVPPIGRASCRVRVCQDV